MRLGIEAQNILETGRQDGREHVQQMEVWRAYGLRSIGCSSPDDEFNEALEYAIPLPNIEKPEP